MIVAALGALVVKINRMSPTRRESFQSLVVFSMGSKRLILSTRLKSRNLRRSSCAVDDQRERT